MIPLTVPVGPIGGDLVAMAYRAFDHWQKQIHTDCVHESLLECMADYADAAPTGGPMAKKVERAKKQLTYAVQAELCFRLLAVIPDMSRELVAHIFEECFGIANTADFYTRAKEQV